MSAPGILEQNVARLLARSHVRVQATDAFRARLAIALEAELADSRRTSARAGPPVPMGSRLSFSNRRVALAAAILAVLALAVFTFFTRSSHARSLDEILASGATAVREHATGRGSTPWRALDAVEIARGLEVPEHGLDVATALPPTLSAARLWLGSDGVVNAASDTRFAIGERDPSHASHPSNASESASARTLTIERGAVRIERYAAGAAWAIEGADTRIELERGVLAARIEAVAAHGDSAQGTPETCLVAELESGVAYALVDGARLPLVRGMRLLLRGSRVLAAHAEIEQPFDSTSRTSQPPADRGSNPSTSTDAQSIADKDGHRAVNGKSILSGTLHAPADTDMPHSYTVSVLRHERLPAVGIPSATVFEATAAFELDGLKPGTYDVFVEARGFATWRVSGLELAADATHALDVALERSRIVRGRVVDAETNTPLAGAVVISEDDVPAQIVPFTLDAAALPWFAATASGPDGTFELTGLSGATTTLRASHPGHGAAWSAPLQAGAADEDRAPIVLALPHAGSIRGRVARDDGAPWSGAIVIASFIGSEARFARMSYGMSISDHDGAYQIDDLPAGSYVLLHFQAAPSNPAVVPAREVRVVAGESTIVNLPEGGTRVHGVLRASDGQPLDGMDVTLKRSGIAGARGWESRRTRDGGVWSFEGVAPGVVEIYVGTALGESFAWQGEFEVPAVPDLVHDVQLAQGSIGGRVSAHDDVAIGRAFVLLETQKGGAFRFAGKTMTDADGRFAFEGLPLNTYRVTAYALRAHLAPVSSDELWLTTREPALVRDLALERGATLRVRVVEPGSGAPVAAAAVHFVAADGRAWQLTAEDVTDARGELVVPGIPAGRWSVTATSGARSAAPITLDLIVDQEREIVLTLAP